MSEEKKRKFVVVTGISYKTPNGEKRAKPGDVVDDLPKRSVGWLKRQKIIREVDRD
jgi:hypothetical protein